MELECIASDFDYNEAQTQYDPYIEVGMSPRDFL